MTHEEITRKGMTREEMVEELEAYINHIIMAHDCLCAYKSILKASHLYNKQINLALRFFTLSQYSLNNCLLIELRKLYYETGEEKTLQKLICQIQANLHLFPKKISHPFLDADDPEKISYVEEIKIILTNDIKEAKKQLTFMEPILNNLKGSRDKYLAHNDKEYFYGKVDPSWDFPISFNDVNTLITIAGDFSNKMLTYLTNRSIIYQS